MFSRKSKAHSKPKNVFELKGAIRLRKLRLSLFLLFIFYLPYGALVMSISPSEQVGFVFVIIYFCAIAFVAFWYSFAKCPRCNKFFTWTGLFANGFTSKCLHCGLSIRKRDLVLELTENT